LPGAILPAFLLVNRLALALGPQRVKASPHPQGAPMGHRMTDERPRKRRRKRPLGARLALIEVDDDTTTTLFADVPSRLERAESSNDDWIIDLRAQERRPAQPRRHITHIRDSVHQTG
jgi:hypothetical protein